jgi:hypothetical protein
MLFSCSPEIRAALFQWLPLRKGGIRLFVDVRAARFPEYV